MHIPNGSLCPITCVSYFAAMAPAWFFTVKKIKQNLNKNNIKSIAVGTAFSFALMMLNLPISGGTTGHAVGAVFLSVMFGPFVSAMCVTLALAVQAVLFGDGGITTFAANSFIIAYVPAFGGYYLYQALSSKFQQNSVWQVLSVGVSSYLAMVAASFFAGLTLGLQPLLAHSASGVPLYFPYGLSVSIPAVVGEHARYIAFVEAFVSMIMTGVLLNEKVCQSLLAEVKSSDAK